MVVRTCSRHGTASQLACARCGTPICPRCLVRTAVGFKCSACSTGPTPARSRSGLRIAVTLLVAAVVLAIPVAVRWGIDRGASAPAPQQPSSVSLPGLGEEVRDASLTFTAKSFSCRDEPGQATPDGPPRQACLLVLGAVNHSAAPAELFGRLQYVVDEAGRRYGPEEGIIEPFLEVLNPDEAGELTLPFLVPAGAAIEQLEVHAYPGSLGSRIRVDTPT